MTSSLILTLNSEPAEAFEGITVVKEDEYDFD